ncbi:MAG: hypothetical protein ABSB34_00275 [Candidatus Limnocylindrales bacterium]|jgi:putative restriction endonuclease
MLPDAAPERGVSCGHARRGSESPLAAFEWLREQLDLRGDVLPRALLEQGFVFEGGRVPLVGPQGIFKPRVCDLPLSITTIPGGEYADQMSGSALRYS